MTSRGLPGFLRRSRRRDEYEDDVSNDTPGDDDDDDDDGNNSNDDDDGNGGDDNNNDTNDVPSMNNVVIGHGNNNNDDDENNNNNHEVDSQSGSTKDYIPSRNNILDPSPLAESSAQEDATTGIVWNRHNNSRNGGDEDDDQNGMVRKDSLSSLGDSDHVLDDTLPSMPASYHRNDSNNNNNNNSRTMPGRMDHPTTTNTSSAGSESKRLTYRELQFEKVLAEQVVKMAELRTVGWNGIPPQFRGTAWKILLGYLPTNATRRQQTLERKRAEYKEAIRQHYDIDDNSRTLQEQETLRQVLVDVPRTAPEIPLFRNEKIKRALARLLYIWAMRHPASSYVQGINDLATPLFAVFLADLYEGEDVLDGSVMVVLTEERLDEVEADVYWCLTNILAGIQDHYTADQPGVQRMVMRLQELVNRIDGDLCDHIQSVGIQFMQFAFKWMNCLLLREFNMKCVIRLWDTYISEDGGNGFEDFHVYVCAAFLCQFSSQLQSMGFDELFHFMQQVPTEDWGETEIEMLLSQAYVLSTLFGGSDAHLTSTNRVPHAAGM